MKYDDITLIKYVNNELEVHLVKELENEINNDEELKKRVKVFKFMTYEKLRHANQIIDLIDNNKVTLNQRLSVIPLHRDFHRDTVFTGRLTVKNLVQRRFIFIQVLDECFQSAFVAEPIFTTCSLVS